MDEKWFDNNGSPDSLFSMMLVQTDAVNCIGDGRKWATEYFHELAGTFSETQASACLRIAEAFRKVSGIAGEMSALAGNGTIQKRCCKISAVVLSEKSRDN